MRVAWPIRLNEEVHPGGPVAQWIERPVLTESREVRVLPGPPHGR